MENNNNTNNNDSKWDKNLLVAVIAIVVGAVVTIATPELRRLFCLERGKSVTQAPPVPALKPELTLPKVETSQSKSAPKIEQQHVEKAKPPSGPFSATIHENQTQFIEEAKTRLSIIFNEEYKIVTLTIAPDGKQSLNLAVLNGYTEEFTSSTGVFLVHILNVDWDSRTVTVQVSRKS